MSTQALPTAKLEARPWSRITERLELAYTPPDQARKAVPVVVAVVLLTVAVAGWALLTWAPATPNIGVTTVLVGLGFLAETMPYYSGEDRRAVAVGSVAFIPYAAALFCYPDPRLVFFVCASQVAVQLWHKRRPLKAIFNAAQFTLSVEAGLAVLRAVGAPVGAMGSMPFTETMISWGLPGLAAFVAMIATNKVCVGAVVSRVSAQKFTDFLQSSMRQAVVLSLLQVIFALYLAWLATSLGLIGAVGMVLPILAVRQLTSTTIQLTKVTEELLDLMVAAIEARDPYTSGHSQRVAKTAVTIARALRLKPSEVERIHVAALLHDVGKIHEEFARVLAKEGRLTPDEWEVMKRHPVRSAELVGLVTTLKDVVPAVRHHHENWDGTGYPACLRGESIPLASRIIMFADTLDAITTDRPYRKALDAEEARSEFIKFKGKQFDPRICEIVVCDEVWSQLYDAAQRTSSAAAREPGITVVA